VSLLLSPISSEGLALLVRVVKSIILRDERRLKRANSLKRSQLRLDLDCLCWVLLKGTRIFNKRALFHGRASILRGHLRGHWRHEEGLQWRLKYWQLLVLCLCGFKFYRFVFELQLAHKLRVNVVLPAGHKQRVVANVLLLEQVGGVLLLHCVELASVELLAAHLFSPLGQFVSREYQHVLDQGLVSRLQDLVHLLRGHHV